MFATNLQLNLQLSVDLFLLQERLPCRRQQPSAGRPCMWRIECAVRDSVSQLGHTRILGRLPVVVESDDAGAELVAARSPLQRIQEEAKRRKAKQILLAMDTNDRLSAGHGQGRWADQDELAVAPVGVDGPTSQEMACEHWGVQRTFPLHQSTPSSRQQSA